MNAIDDVTREIPAAELEASFGTLTAKLTGLQQSLSSEEQAVFATIIASAAERISTVESTTEADRLMFAKPISATATPGVRLQIMGLPQALNGK